MGPVLFLVFLITWQAQGQKILPGLKNYESVYPQKLQSKFKRGTEATYPDVLQYELSMQGEKRVLHLEKTQDLVNNEYTETYYDGDGEPVTTTPKTLEHCQYQGFVQDESDSSLSLSTCNGLSGLMKMGGEKYLIQPLQQSDEEEHAVFKYEDLETEPKVCGVTGSSRDDEPTVLDFEEEQKLFKTRRYVELYVVVDNSVCIKYEKNVSAIRNRVLQMVNYVNLVYKPIKTFVALTGMEYWNKENFITVVPQVKETLSRFAQWREDNLLKRKKHDNAQLLTNVDFEGTTIGLAYLREMCSDFYSCGVIQDHSIPSVLVGATIAHEMGHNLGMEHDKGSSCKCEHGSCIMATTLSSDVPKDFSGCSLKDMRMLVDGNTTQCIRNKPSPKSVVPNPVCGNNFVEVGEECDCGTDEECISECCDASTCKLKPEAACADGACCEGCQVKSAGALCRPAKDECDLPDMCDGQSGNCPKDIFRVNGHPCKNGDGHCYMGTCPTLQDQCVAVWGQGVTTQPSCFNTNRVGKYYGYCTRNGKNYKACRKKDTLCGKLYCMGGNELPVQGSSVKMKKTGCKTSSAEGLVEEGTKCGDGLVCSSARCINIHEAYKAKDCMAKCKENQVCNHELNCQCKEGYVPPDCTEQPPQISDMQFDMASSGEELDVI